MPVPSAHPPQSDSDSDTGYGRQKAASEERSFAPIGITNRQLECLYWVQHGKSAKDIGGILGISSRTVEGHIIKICDHLGVKTRFQAVLKARDLGLLSIFGP